MKGIKTSFMYTIREKDPSGINAHDNGAYKNSCNVKSYYGVLIDDDGKISTRTVYKSSKDTYYYNERVGSKYEKTMIGKKNVYELDRNYRVNKTITTLKRTICGVKSMDSFQYEDFLCVIYSNSSEIQGEVQILPHRNSKGYTPCIATSKKVLRREEEILAQTNKYGKTYDMVVLYK